MKNKKTPATLQRNNALAAAAWQRSRVHGGISWLISESKRGVMCGVFGIGMAKWREAKAQSVTGMV
jgi:hypothetical protein